MHPEMPGNKYSSSFGQFWIIQSPPPLFDGESYGSNGSCRPGLPGWPVGSDGSIGYGGSIGFGGSCESDWSDMFCNFLL